MSRRNNSPHPIFQKSVFEDKEKANSVSPNNSLLVSASNNNSHRDNIHDNSNAEKYEKFNLFNSGHDSSGFETSSQQGLRKNIARTKSATKRIKYRSAPLRKAVYDTGRSSAIASPARRVRVDSAESGQEPREVPSSDHNGQSGPRKDNEYRYSFLGSKAVPKSDDFVIDDTDDENASGLHSDALKIRYNGSAKQTRSRDNSKDITDFVENETILVPLKSTPQESQVASASRFKRVPTPAHKIHHLQRALSFDGRKHSDANVSIVTPGKKILHSLTNYDSSMDSISNSSINQLYSSIHRGINNALISVNELGSRQGTPITSRIASPRLPHADLSLSSIRRQGSVGNTKAAHSSDYDDSNKFVKNQKNKENDKVGSNEHRGSLAVKTDFYVATVNSLNNKINLSRTPEGDKDEISIENERVSNSNSKGKDGNNKKRQYENVSENDSLDDVENVFDFISKHGSGDSKAEQQEPSKSNRDQIKSRIRQLSERLPLLSFAEGVEGAQIGKQQISKVPEEQEKETEVGSSTPEPGAPDEEWSLDKWKLFAKLIQEARRVNDPSIVYNQQVYSAFEIQDRVEMNIRIQIVKRLIFGWKKGHRNGEHGHKKRKLK